MRFYDAHYFLLFSYFSSSSYDVDQIGKNTQKRVLLFFNVQLLFSFFNFFLFIVFATIASKLLLQKQN